MATTDATISWLRATAGPELYRQNPFRTTGLTTTADRRTVRQRQQQLVAALAIGADTTVTKEQARAAFDRALGDPRRRLLDEVFWLWGPPSACACPARVHENHDEAIRAHSAALDIEANGPADPEAAAKLWADAAARWKKTLRHNGFWAHLRHRVAALDDRQLDESLVEVLHVELPVALVRPLVGLAASAGDGARSRLADLARGWPAPQGTVTDLLEGIAEPHYATLDTARRDIGRLISDGDLDALTPAVHEQLLPALHRVQELLPPTAHRRTATAGNDVAITLNNCANALLDGRGAPSAADARTWYQRAKEYATDPETLAAVDRNRAELDSLVTSYEALRAQTAHLVATGRTRMARTQLRQLRSELRDPGSVASIDALLALTDPAPGAPRGTLTGALITTAVLSVLILVILVVLANA